VLAVTGRRRPLLDVPMPLARMLGCTLGVLPGAPLTSDQVRMLETDNVVSAGAVAEGRTLEGLGIQPVTVEAVVPSYLWRFRKTGQFDRERLA
jgi:NADH dehydrogenase